MRPCMLMSEHLNRTEHQHMSAWWAFLRQTWLSTLSTTRCRDLRYEWQPCWKLRMNCAWEYHSRADQAQLSSQICLILFWSTPIVMDDHIVLQGKCAGGITFIRYMCFPSASNDQWHAPLYPLSTLSSLQLSFAIRAESSQPWTARDCLSVSLNCRVVREHGHIDRMRSSL